MAWPPTLKQLKDDLKATNDERYDEALQQNLDAAVAFVERVRPEFRYDPEDTLDERPDPTPDHVLGTIRLAGRWYERRQSPAGLISSADFGAARVPWFDADIERMLRIGRYALPKVG